MKLFEFQAKEIFAQYGIAVPKSALATRETIQGALDEVGFPCVLKSQVLSGGRGKAGLIRVVKDVEDARMQAADLFDSPHGIRQILVEEAVDIARELYLSVTVDPVASTALVIACAEGGVEIETLAVTAPDKIIRENVDIDRGLQAFQARDIAYRMGMEGDLVKSVAAIINKLYGAFKQMDAELAEINPLFITSDGAVLAGDGKLVIDDNSLSRHPDYELTREYFESDAEFKAAVDGIPYLQFDGDISLMCAGAGLTTTVYDLINDEGGSVANYLEFGGPNYKRAKRAMELCLMNDSKVILIVTFGTIARADVMARGVVEAIAALKPDRPIVTCIRGTNEEDAVTILKAAGLTPLYDTEEAVRAAVAISRGNA